MKYEKIKSLEVECTCANISEKEHDKLYEKATQADKRKINQLVKKLLPELYKTLALYLRNPFTYYKTKTHLILVHSATDYFIKYEL